MKLGVYKPPVVPRSMSITTGCIAQELEELGVQLHWFHDAGAPPADVDLVWDPWLGGGNTSELDGHAIPQPVVLTLAGASPFSVPLSESGLNLREKLRLMRERFRLVRQWRRRASGYARIITISQYARQELLRYLPLIPERLVPIPLGKDAQLAELGDVDLAARLDAPYFLHLSYYQPKKNVDRLIAAYLSVADEPGMPDLHVVSTEYPGTGTHAKLVIEPADIGRAAIATYYRGAQAFIFPSLHETFGMPLTEAMLFGLPLLTANTTVCPETAGDAALLVDPTDTQSIAAAMSRLASNAELRKELGARSLARGELFSWRHTAESYLALFEEVLGEAR